MKFMVTWRVHTDKRQDVFKVFSQMTPADDKKDTGDKIKLIGRWHDLSQFTGVAICESDDAQAVASWALNRNSSLDLTTSVVLDDEEARAVGRKKIAAAKKKVRNYQCILIEAQFSQASDSSGYLRNRKQDRITRILYDKWCDHTSWFVCREPKELLRLTLNVSFKKIRI
jgi:hypothetical protein